MSRKVCYFDMILNTFTNKAVVWFDNVWQVAFGEQKRENNDFIFFRNGRIECVHDGNWFSIRFDCTDGQALDVTFNKSEENQNVHQNHSFG